ncbi:MAG: hypothetical protein N3E50_04110 [Candidatus Goldbacteria bacterium]|nr:hypothetical protein [Candidatus Goldiibacteriota bacterium]
MFIHIINDHKNYTIRIQKLSIFNKNNSENWIDGTYSLQRIILNNTVKTLLMFNYQGDGNPRHNYRQKPMLDFVSGILFVLGFGLAIRRILKLEIFFFLSLFLIGILGSILYVAAPHATRTIIILPSIIVFCILSLQKIERCLILYKKNIFNFLICIILILVGVLNYNNYFNGYAKDFDLYDAFHSSRVDAAKYVVSLGNDWRCISAIEFCRQYIVSFAFQFIMEINNKNNYECFDVNKHIPVIPEYDKNYLFLFPMGYESIVNLLKKLYPNGIYKTFYKKNNERYISFFTYEIDKKDIKNPMIKNIKNGLTAYYYKNQNWIGEIMKKKQYFIWVHNDPAKNTGILSIKWVGKIKIDKSGEYVFVGESEDDVYWEIIINGKIIGTSPIRKGKVFDRINVYLDKGMQNFEIRCSSFRDIQKMKMFWIPANQNEPPVIIPNEVLFF